jgi:hypothetical protein
LRTQDELYSHKFYRRAAKAAMQIYMRLLDKPVESKSEETGEADANLSAAEKKKLKHKQKREAKGKEADAGKGDDKNAKGAKKDDDPKGEKLLQSEKMHEDMLTIVRNLCKHCAMDDMTYKFAYYVQQRRGKLLLCIQALVRLWTRGGNDRLMPKLCPLLSHFCFKGGLSADTDERVRSVALMQLGKILESTPKTVDELHKLANKWLDDVEARLSRPLRLAEQLHFFAGLVHGGRASRIAQFVAKIEISVANPMKECEKMVEFLGTVDAKLQDDVRAKCLKAYPDAQRLKEKFTPPDRA